MVRVRLRLRVVVVVVVVVVVRLGLGLVMTVQLMTVQIKMGNHETAAPHFLAHVYCRQTAGWIKIPFGMAVRVGLDHIVLDGNPTLAIRGTAVNFRRCLLWPNACMDQNATWYGDRPQHTRHCVR